METLQEAVRELNKTQFEGFISFLKLKQETSIWDYQPAINEVEKLMRLES